jgi:hypothetical protein
MEDRSRARCNRQQHSITQQQQHSSTQQQHHSSTIGYRWALQLPIKDSGIGSK